MSVTAFYACTDNSLYNDPAGNIRITGNSYKTAFTDGPADGPSTNRSFSLEAGSRILLNAEGGLSKDKEVLTYSGTQWELSDGAFLSDGENPTKITAFYPVYAGAVYTEENLYSGGSLEDMLYVRDVFPGGENIHLQFKHLFSSLTLHLSEELQNEFQQMDIICPAVVAEVSAESAEVIVNAGKSHTVSFTQSSSSGNYSLIIPPGENISVAAAIQAGGKKYATALPVKTFTGNEEYRYQLKIEDKMPGIVTAKDWIAFSKLINSSKLTEYNGKTLKDFGETADGVTTYYLLNDIDFQGVDCSQLEHVGGQNTTRNFEDIFDGKGHTISNLTLRPAYSYTGLFGKTSAASVIKNLSLKSCTADIKKNGAGSSSGIGILVSFSLGTLINCSVENGSILSEQRTIAGGLAGYFKGTIINCHVQNTTISGQLSAGGLTGTSNGVIINSFCASNTIKSPESCGGISGSSGTSPTTIYNCYVHNTTLPKKTKNGLFIGTAQNSVIMHCYYSAQSIGLIGSSGSSTNQTAGNAYYNSNFTDQSGVPVYQLLNEWIVSEAPTLYPEFTFTLWTAGSEELPAVFTRE